MIDLTPQYKYLEGLGYSSFEKEGVVIDGWPDQFLPAIDEQDFDALATAEIVRIDEIEVPVLSAVHVVAAAIRTGRSKDFLRIDQFLEERLVDLEKFRAAILRFGLVDKWRRFVLKTGRDDPFSPSLTP